MVEKNTDKKTAKELTRELYQAVIGIPESPDDNGLIGAVKEIKTILTNQNGRIRETEKGLSRIIGFVTGFSIIISTVITKLCKLW